MTRIGKLAAMVLVGTLVLAGCQPQAAPTQDSIVDNNQEASSEVKPSEDPAGESGQEDQEETPSSEQATENSEGETQPAQPILTTDQMVDSALILRNAIEIQDSILNKETMRFPGDTENMEERVITISSEDQAILKMTVTEPNDAGKMTGLTTYWFKDGEVFFIKQPFALYVIRDNQLMVWLDENMNVVDDQRDTDNMKSRYQFLIDDMVKWMDLFYSDYK